MEKSWLETEEEWNNDTDGWSGTTYMSLERMMSAIDKNDMDAFLSELSPEMVDSYLQFIKSSDEKKEKEKEVEREDEHKADEYEREDECDDD